MNAHNLPGRTRPVADRATDQAVAYVGRFAADVELLALEHLGATRHPAWHRAKGRRAECDSAALVPGAPGEVTAALAAILYALDVAGDVAPLGGAA